MGHSALKTLAPEAIVRCLEPVDAHPDDVRVDLDGQGAIGRHPHAEKELPGFGHDASEVVLSVAPQERLAAF